MLIAVLDHERRGQCFQCVAEQDYRYNIQTSASCRQSAYQSSAIHVYQQPAYEYICCFVAWTNSYLSTLELQACEMPFGLFLSKGFAQQGYSNFETTSRCGALLVQSSRKRDHDFFFQVASDTRNHNINCGLRCCKRVTSVLATSDFVAVSYILEKCKRGLCADVTLSGRPLQCHLK